MFLFIQGGGSVGSVRASARAHGGGDERRAGRRRRQRRQRHAGSAGGAGGAGAVRGVGGARAAGRAGRGLGAADAGQVHGAAGAAAAPRQPHFHRSAGVALGPVEQGAGGAAARVRRGGAPRGRRARRVAPPAGGAQVAVLRPAAAAGACACACACASALVQAEDYLAAGGVVSLLREARSPEAGLLSSLYSYIALGETVRAPTPNEKALIDIATDCVAKCNLPGLFVTETKFLQIESLQEMVRAMVVVGTPPDSESVQLNPELEDVTIFFLELLGQTLIQNRDRSLSLWDIAEEHYWAVVAWAGGRGARVLRRALTALLRTAARLMRAHACAPRLLRALRPLLRPAAAPAPALVVRGCGCGCGRGCCVPTRLRIYVKFFLILNVNFVDPALQIHN
ncbi:hypothetical protein ACJJTC_000031 [Scirpophaga incertulas]